MTVPTNNRSAAAVTLDLSICADWAKVNHPKMVESALNLAMVGPHLREMGATLGRNPPNSGRCWHKKAGSGHVNAGPTGSPRGPRGRCAKRRRRPPPGAAVHDVSRGDSDLRKCSECGACPWKKADSLAKAPQWLAKHASVSPDCEIVQSGAARHKQSPFASSKRKPDSTRWLSISWSGSARERLGQGCGNGDQLRLEIWGVPSARGVSTDPGTTPGTGAAPALGGPETYGSWVATGAAPRHRPRVDPGPTSDPG